MSKTNLYIKNIFRLIVTPGFILLTIVSIINLQKTHLKLEANKKITKDYAELEQAKAAKLEIISKLPSFGFENLIADFAFLDFIQYFGDYDARAITGYRLNPDFFEIIVKNDPLFVESYLYLAPATSLFAGQPSKTVSYMSKGLKSLSPEISRSYLVWTYKAVDELLFLGDKQAAKKSYETGAKWASYYQDKASQIIGKRAQETALFLESNPDSKKAQASSWMMIYTNSRDETTRKLAVQQIKSLGGELVINQNRITLKMPEDNNG